MEVVVTLRFTTPCLGDQRGGDVDRMRRDSSGRVVFLQSWWRSSLKFAAQAINRYQRDVVEIQADPLVDGATQIYKRFYSPDKFTAHEAFLDGDVITCRFLLPNQVSIGAFRQLLEVAGQYAGISPYGFKQNYGRFVVISIKPARRVLNAANTNPTCEEHDPGDTGSCRTTGSGVDVHEADTGTRVQS